MSDTGPLRVGVICFSTFGGSGVVASEIALSMAARGHTVHVFSDDRPSNVGNPLMTASHVSWVTSSATAREGT